MAKKNIVAKVVGIAFSLALNLASAKVSTDESPAQPAADNKNNSTMQVNKGGSPNLNTKTIASQKADISKEFVKEFKRLNSSVPEFSSSLKIDEGNLQKFAKVFPDKAKEMIGQILDEIPHNGGIREGSSRELFNNIVKDIESALDAILQVERASKPVLQAEQVKIIDNITTELGKAVKGTEYQKIPDLGTKVERFVTQQFNDRPQQSAKKDLNSINDTLRIVNNPANQQLAVMGNAAMQKSYRKETSDFNQDLRKWEKAQNAEPTHYTAPPPRERLVVYSGRGVEILDKLTEYPEPLHDAHKKSLEKAGGSLMERTQPLRHAQSGWGVSNKILQEIINPPKTNTLGNPLHAKPIKSTTSLDKYHAENGLKYNIILKESLVEKFKKMAPTASDRMMGRLIDRLIKSQREGGNEVDRQKSTRSQLAYMSKMMGIDYTKETITVKGQGEPVYSKQDQKLRSMDKPVNEAELNPQIAKDFIKSWKAEQLESIMDKMGISPAKSVDKQPKAKSYTNDLNNGQSQLRNTAQTR